MNAKVHFNLKEGFEGALGPVESMFTSSRTPPPQKEGFKGDFPERSFYVLNRPVV